MFLGRSFIGIQDSFDREGKGKFFQFFEPPEVTAGVEGLNLFEEWRSGADVQTILKYR